MYVEIVQGEDEFGAEGGGGASQVGGGRKHSEGSMLSRPRPLVRRLTPVLLGTDLSAVLWELLTASAREDATTFLALLADADDALAASTEPHWTAWRHALAARRSLIENDPDAA